MFFSSDMLSKRGPLARVWLAAHVEKRLSKTQLLTTSIPQSVVAILDPSTTTAVPLALRLSGQLLLGVTRIYGRKAKYLLDDCNEALLKIKMAFRTGGGAAAVDMSEEQEQQGREGINLKDRTGGVLDFELMYGGGAYDAWDYAMNADSFEPKAGAAFGDGANARIDADVGDITLPEHEALIDGGGAFDWNLDFAGGAGIDSQDYDMNEALDLGLFDLDDAAGTTAGQRAGKPKKRPRSPSGLNGFIDDDDTFDMEVGRDAANDRSARESLGSALDAFKGADADITLDSGAGGYDPMDVDRPIFEPDFVGGFDNDIDLGLDANGLNSRQVTPVPGEREADETIAVTPRTARRVADMPSAKKASSASKRKPKAALEDAVTEMDSRLTGRGFGKAGTSAESRQARIEKGLVVEPVLLPRTREEALLRAIRNDPAKYYLPRPVERDGKEWMLVAPPGLPEELENLFLVEKPLPLTKALGGKRVAIADDAGRPGKRARTGDDDVELGRERQGSFVGGGMGLDDTFDMTNQDDFGGFNVDDFQHDYPAARSVASREASFPVGEALPDLTFDMPELGESILSIFDEDGVPGQASEQPATKWSKNTVRALKVLKKELGPDEADDVDETDGEKTMSFQDVSNQASRRAASAFFFELLILGTRDCVKLDQEETYGDIKVQGRDRLWEVIGNEGLAGKEQAV